MSTARVTLKFVQIPFEAFFAGAANVIFRHASTGVWVKEVRELDPKKYSLDEVKL